MIEFTLKIEDEFEIPVKIHPEKPDDWEEDSEGIFYPKAVIKIYDKDGGFSHVDLVKNELGSIEIYTPFGIGCVTHELQHALLYYVQINKGDINDLEYEEKICEIAEKLMAEFWNKFYEKDMSDKINCCIKGCTNYFREIDGYFIGIYNNTKQYACNDCADDNIKQRKWNDV